MLLTTYKEYQNKAIESLVTATADLISKSEVGNKIIVFQSPTGSGKTYMVSRFMRDFIEDYPENDVCFLWISIGKGELHKQSKKSIQKILGSDYRCNVLEDTFFGSRSYIERNELVVANWEKLRGKDKKTGEWSSKLMRESENVNFIEVLENTKKRRKTILIIDESHYASDTQRTNELRQIVNADVTLEMSATPKLQPSPIDIAQKNAYFIYVNPKDVIDEGMIKKEIIINEALDKLVDDEKTSQDIIIESAYNKRLELKQAFAETGVDINPLCLIQLPNSEAGETKKEIVAQFLNSKGITENNGKLAVWLSEEKSDGLDVISDFHSEVEFLIFKQAIDTGWDCPRAHILVKLRETGSYTFEVQTVGRILRMPEQMHYDNDILNRGYIYTNLQSITIAKEDYNPNIIKHLKAIRKPIYKPLKLQSYYKSRVDFGDITSSFVNTLENVFCKYFGMEINPTLINTAENCQKVIDKFMVITPEPYDEKIIIDEIIDNTKFDELEDKDFETFVKRTKLRLANNDLYDIFNIIIRQNLNGFAPKRSTSTVRGSIYQWFRKYLSIDYNAPNGMINIQNLFLHPNNIAVYSRLLNEATEVYKPAKKQEVKDKIEEKDYIWEVKFEEFYNEHSDELFNCNLNIYDKCYLSKIRSNPEKDFEKYLETKAEKIEWWFKNGVSKQDFFGIRYEENEFPKTFYPDYIVLLKNGKTLIADTKAGNTAVEAKSRAEALYKYIETENAKGKNLIGGILVQQAEHWKINLNETHLYDKNDLTNWKFLEDII
jgi:type III restriction enzyme